MSVHKEESQLVDFLTKEPGLDAIKGEIATVGAGADAGTVGILLRGEGTPIPGVRYMAHYSPTVGDVVWCLKIGPSVIVLGKLADRP